MSGIAEQQTTSSRAAAGFAGIGGGTGLVAIAGSLPETSPLKPWLVYAAPSIAVLIGGLWLWAQVEIANAVRGAKVRRVARRLKQDLLEAMNAPTCPEAHKQVLQGRLEQVNLALADRGLRELAALEPLTSEQFRRKVHDAAGDQQP